jgi:hypothetical protein
LLTPIYQRDPRAFLGIPSPPVKSSQECRSSYLHGRGRFSQCFDKVIESPQGCLFLDSGDSRWSHAISSNMLQGWKICAGNITSEKEVRLYEREGVHY